MQIKEDKAVSIQYSLRNDEGTVIYDDQNLVTLTYLHGKNNLIRGLEKALEGKQAGDEMEVYVIPEEGYGDYHAEYITELDRKMFEGVEKIEVGMQFHAARPDGVMQIVTVKQVDGDKVTVDGNHPFAGQKLFFKVKVLQVRDSTAEERAHGHAHGEGGAHH